MTALGRSLVGLALVTACVDNGNDVGYRLPISGGGAGGGAGASAGASTSAGSGATTLPPLPQLGGVEATVRGDSVHISFEPLADAVDYRVYELPPNEDISVQGEDFTIRNALYRCAGKRQTPAVVFDDNPTVPSGYMKTLVEDQDVYGYVRSLDEATLGHVYLEPGRDRVPVYALGDADPLAENENYFMRWAASRVKEYVVSETERTQLLDLGYRDDGVAFYAPGSESEDTRWIYTSTDAQARYYFSDGPEAAVRSDATPAFLALASAAPGTAPLMRVFYLNLSSTSHDELVMGQPRFERARRQGDQLPMFELHWSGLRQPTTLVVEALNPGCPTPPGLLSPVSLPGSATHPAWVTLDEARAASPDAALYVNGQHDPTSRPRAIARAFLSDIAPQPPPDLDWHWGFSADDDIGTFSELPCGDPACYQDFRRGSERFDASFHLVDTERQALGTMLGELWVLYADHLSGVNGKFRMTPPEMAEVSADSYLHVTMEVNSFTTARRYPQIIISDQQAPVQHNLPLGNALVIHPYGDWPHQYEVQLCDHRAWDVNDHCPYADFDHYFDPDDTARTLSLAPNAEVGEHVGVDRSTLFDVYASTERVYLLLDGEPYGCFDLPATGVLGTQVSVTFGDTLFHSANDQLQFYQYVRENLQFDAQRHFDNLGFKSGAAAPAWPEARLPCTSALFTRP
ncbi:MAG TPA: hypothetical protein VEX18_07370 [Polyangiaceae bacterium]|nr:hypothetical protein [Polyangiaceae bacterium]